jgi:hypothetical protein
VGLVQAFTTLSFGAASAGRRKWTAVFTFDDNPVGAAASNAQLAYSSGIPSITFANVRAGCWSEGRPVQHCCMWMRPLFSMLQRLLEPQPTRRKRVTIWLCAVQYTDASGNAQAVSITEFLEAGGPGMQYQSLYHDGPMTVNVCG